MIDLEGTLLLTGVVRRSVPLIPVTTIKAGVAEFTLGCDF